MPGTKPPERPAGTSLSLSAILVVAGMIVSRVSGFIRTALFTPIFGLGEAADAYQAAVRIPNFLQNLLGEGVLSASLIPVYATLLKKEHRAGADRVARAVLAVLAVITTLLVIVGVVWASTLVTLASGGFSGHKRDLTIQLVRILFPGVGLLVLSAWCLAILNSHHKFFLSYVAPALWNGAIIVALLHFQHSQAPPDEIAVDLAWATVVGAALQLAIQLPGVWGVMTFRKGPHPIELGTHVRQVLAASIPVIFTRGVVQVSAFVDTVIASYLPATSGAVTALALQQQLYTLPISLFGMAISSAALPTMAASAVEDSREPLRRHVIGAQQMIVVLAVPSVVAFLGLGDVMVAMLFQRGAFTTESTRYVWGILAGSAVGLIATTVGRLYSSAFYALGDTRTPTRFAILRVVLVGLLGYLLAILVPPYVGIEARWGAAGLTISAGFAGWVEFALLRRALQQRIGAIEISRALLVKAWMAALLAVGVALAVRWSVSDRLAAWSRTAHLPFLVVQGLLVVGVYGAVYLGLAHATRLFEVRTLLRRALRRGR